MNYRYVEDMDARVAFGDLPFGALFEWDGSVCIKAAISTEYSDKEVALVLRDDMVVEVTLGALVLPLKGEVIVKKSGIYILPGIPQK